MTSPLIYIYSHTTLPFLPLLSQELFEGPGAGVVKEFVRSRQEVPGGGAREDGEGGEQQEKDIHPAELSSSVLTHSSQYTEFRIEYISKFLFDQNDVRC